MRAKVARTLSKHALILPGQHVLIGVSGGADSVALANVLAMLRERLEATIGLAHLNHRIRRDGADRDQAFVEALGAKLGVEVITASSNVPALARRNGWSVEMAARSARHRFFRRALKQSGADGLALAHTADDQAETVLLRLIRGAGMQGLGAMEYRTELKGMHIVRPMLDVTHGEAVHFLRRLGMAWCEDESNTDLRIQRNRVRNELMPLLTSRYNVRVRDALLRTAAVLREDNDWLNRLTADLLEACRDSDQIGALDTKKWEKQPSAARRRILLLWLIEQGLAPEVITFEFIEKLDALAGRGRGTRRVMLPGQRAVVVSYRKIYLEKVEPASPEPFRAVLNIPGETLLSEQDLRVSVYREKGFSKPGRSRIGSLPSGASIDMAAVGRARLVLRSRRPGDRFRPLGMRGSRKIQDIFVDEKIPLSQRLQIPLLECKGEIVWIPGYQVARGWEVKRPRVFLADSSRAVG